MSNETGKGEEQTAIATEQQSAPRSACAHPEAVGMRWGDPISQERQAELQGYLDRWQAETDHGERRGPFENQGEVVTVQVAGVDVKVRSFDDDVNRRLTGADVSWLVKQSPVNGFGWTLTRHLEGANLSGAHLEGASLTYAHLEGAHLTFAHMEHAELDSAHLQGADLNFAHLEGTMLSVAHLEGGNLQGVWLDSKTQLERTVLDSRTMLGDIHWGGLGIVDLTNIDWGRLPWLGEEDLIASWSQALDYEGVVRANRQVATQLQAQGMNEDADRFAYRAQLLEQQVLWRQHKVGGYFFSRFLDALAGYGYYPGRAVLWYLATVFGFACAYFFIGHTGGIIPGPVDAVVFSLTSFHGRGFFPSEKVSLHSPLIVLAALEAVIGLLIEISFIATFTQRFFGR